MHWIHQYELYLIFHNTHICELSLQNINKIKLNITFIYENYLFILTLNYQVSTNLLKTNNIKYAKKKQTTTRKTTYFISHFQNKFQQKR